MSKTLESQLKRPVMEGVLPAGARAWPSDVSKFKMRPLTLGEELDAAKAASLLGGTEAALEAETIRRMVIEVDGRPTGDNLDWLDEQSPQARGFLKIAYAKLSNSGVDAKDVDDFVKGLAITLG